MTEANDERGLFSRLPEDPAYWRDLTNRIMDDGLPRIAENGAVKPKWWSELARFSGILAAGAAAAILAFLLLAPRTGEAERQVRTMETYGLIPSDPLAVTLASREAPPAIEALIALRNVEYDR